MIDHGKFTPYVRTFKPGDPPIYTQVLWLRNEDEDDWYAYQKDLPAGVYATLDDDRRIVTISDDPSTLVPNGLRLVQFASGEVSQSPSMRGRVVNEDGTIQEPPPAPAVAAVTPLQARKALTQAGLRDSVESWVAAQAQGVRDAWDYAIQIERTDPVLGAAATALGLTEQQVDDLFALAAIL
jgi:hypothetical protein